MRIWFKVYGLGLRFRVSNLGNVKDLVSGLAVYGLEVKVPPRFRARV